MKNGSFSLSKNEITLFRLSPSSLLEIVNKSGQPLNCVENFRQKNYTFPIFRGQK